MEGNILETIGTIVIKWIPIATSIIGSFALIATQTPNKSDDRIVQVIQDIVNFLAGNFGKSKNA